MAGRRAPARSLACLLRPTDRSIDRPTVYTHPCLCRKPSMVGAAMLKAQACVRRLDSPLVLSSSRRPE